jgi:hypothetical protein
MISVEIIKIYKSQAVTRKSIGSDRSVYPLKLFDFKIERETPSVYKLAAKRLLLSTNSRSKSL